jgi:hypothetical protein
LFFNIIQEERNTAYDDQYSSESDEEVISHRQIEAAENGKIETETSESETDDDEKVNCMTSANATSKNAIDRQMNREEQEEEEDEEEEEEEEEEEKEEDRRKDSGRENVGERGNEKSNDSSYMTTESSSDDDGQCADDEEDEIAEGSDKSVDNVAAKKVAGKAKKKNAVRKTMLTKEQIRKFNPYNRPPEVVAIEHQDGENVAEINPENKLTLMQLSPTVSVAKLTLLQMAAANSVPLENNQFGNSKPEIASKLMETNLSSQRTSKIPVDSPSQQKHFIRCPFSNADLKKFASEGFTGQKLVDKLYAESYQRLFSKSGLIEKDLAALNFGDFESDLFFFLQVKDASEITRYGSFGFKRTFREVIRDSGKRSVMKSAEYCIVCEQGMNNQKDAYCHEIKHGTPYSIITEYAKSDPTSILSHYGPMNYFSPGMKMIKGKDKRKKSEEEGQIASGDDSPERKKKCDNAKTYSKRKKSGKNVKKTKISQ